MQVERQVECKVERQVECRFKGRSKGKLNTVERQVKKSDSNYRAFDSAFTGIRPGILTGLDLAFNGIRLGIQRYYLAYNGLRLATRSSFAHVSRRSLPAC